MMRVPTQWFGGAMAGTLVIAGMVGCANKEAVAPEPAPTPAPLASVNGVEITEEDYESEVARRVAAGRPLEQPEDILQDLVERQAMLDQAEASGVLEDPQVKREVDNKRLGQWLDRSLQVERDAVRVSDDELLAHYETEQNSFTRPEMVRFAMLYRRTNPADSEEAANALREDLQQGRAWLLIIIR